MAGERPLVRTLLVEGEATLSAQHVPAADWDAERLLRHALGWDRARVFSEPEAVVAPEVVARFRELLEARARRVPLQHLVGTQEFWRREFEVSGEALIPRPETEIVVEEALKLLVEADAPHVVDVGTGSGCIALSLAAERPAARVVGSDVSPRALGLATRNASRLGVRDRVRLVASDLLACFRPEPIFDLIVSNPPYAPGAHAAGLAPEVRDHEPAVALFGGEDGLALYRRLLPQSRERLESGGHLILEMGLGQEDAVTGLCGGAGLFVERVVSDLQGIPRVVVASAP